ncbi:MAG: hypothetical protein JRI57_10845 [Deltaproteobacteria bacterium]|nr:hypothetical protein [Deltaproteobacteria bacterium]MBW1953451.1 hypothetical protein [Deltaproteobacteria bacterium]MBW1987505.1 hypothetical protein [Deltaproteobacteria bacterium]MBW2135919.1 hypothetical protein [Deltaproteobacteria bacterium]
MLEDRIDRFCNQIHVACIGLQRLKRQAPYRRDLIFVNLVEDFCKSGHHLMGLIRKWEGHLTQNDFH